MFFKIFCFTLGAFILIGCANEKQPYYKTPDIKLQGASCIKNAATNFKAFVSGKATEQQVNQIWPCFGYVLKTFQTYFKGESSKDEFTPQEIRKFIQDFFLNDTDLAREGKDVISNALLEELMRIKVLFLGGSARLVTKSELSTTIWLTEQLHNISLDILPYTPVIFAGVDKAPDFAIFDLAMDKTEGALQKIVNLLPGRTIDYSLSSLQRLLEELDIFFSSIDKGSQNKLGWDRYIPIAVNAKKILLNSNHDRIRGQDWNELAKIVSQMVRAGLNVRYYLDEDFLIDAQRFDRVGESIDSVSTVLFDTFDRRQNRPITQMEVAPLLEEISKVDLLPFDLTAQSAAQTWQLLTDKLLNPQNKHSQIGFTTVKLNYIIAEAQSWISVQQSLFTNKNDKQNPRWTEMVGVLSTPWAVSLDVQNKIILDGSADETNLVAKSRLNWSRALFSALYRVYINDSSRLFTMQLSREELQIAYTDLKTILVGIGLVNENSNDFATRLFRDANLFMPRSNGNELLEFYEIIEYMHFVLAGIKAGKLFVQTLPNECQSDDENYQVSCFRSGYYANLTSNYDHLPYYLSYVARSNNEQRKKDLKNIEIINRTGGITDNPVIKTDIYEMFVMLQYLEVTMLNFDKDRSGDLNLVEALRMLKLFRRVIADLIGLDIDVHADEIEAVFTYILKYEELPNPDDPLGQMRFNNWKYQKANWSLNAKRGTLLKILAIIKKSSN